MLMTAVVLWGLTVPPTKWALESVQPFTLIFLRLLIAGTLFLPYAWNKARRGNQSISVPWKRMFLLSFTGVAGYFLFSYWGIALTSGVNASILNASIPFFTLSLAAVYLREPISLQQWFGLILGIIGVLFISVHPGDSGRSSYAGDLLVLASCLMWAIYVIQMKRPQAETKLTSELFTALTMLIGALMVFPFAMGEWWKYGSPVITAKALWSTVFLAIGSSIFAYWLWNKAIEVTSAARAGIYLNALPLVSVLSSIFFLGETVTWRTLTGGCLVLIGVFWAEKRRPLTEQGNTACDIS
jgi:drug/metabolite transporter (DMT)-like permease